MWISGVIIFLFPFTFLCLLFPYLEIGPNATWPASLECFVRFDYQNASSLKGVNIHGFDGRMTHHPNHTVINATPSSSLRESPSAVGIWVVEKTSSSPQSQFPQSLSPLGSFLLLSGTWCENLIRYNIKVLVFRQRKLSLADYVQIQQVKSTFLLLWALAQYQSSKAAGWVSSFPTTQPFRTSSLKIYSVMLISEIIRWVKRNYLQLAGWLGRWQTPGLSWVEGHFLRDTGVPNVTSGKDSSLSSAPNIRISTDAAMFKTVNSLLWNIWVWVFLLNNWSA